MPPLPPNYVEPHHTPYFEPRPSTPPPILLDSVIMSMPVETATGNSDTPATWPTNRTHARSNSPVTWEILPVASEAVHATQEDACTIGDEVEENADVDDVIMDDDEAQSSDESSGQHAALERLIAEHQKALRHPKTIISHTKAATKILDLEYLRRFNDRRYELQNAQQKQRNTLANAQPRMRPMLKRRMRSIRPSTQAAMDVTRDHSKGLYFARRLRNWANCLLRTGDLPESNQGKGASHATLLAHPEVLRGVKQFVVGVISLKDGGFEGQVSFIKLILSSVIDLHVSDAAGKVS